MVQRLAYLAFTEEAGVRLPVTENLFVTSPHPISNPLFFKATYCKNVSFANTCELPLNESLLIGTETCLPCYGSVGLHWSH